MTVHAKIPNQPTVYENLIGGRWSASTGGEIIRNSPAHGVPVSIVPRGTKEDVERAVQAARKRFDTGGWADLPAARRAAIIRKAADIILQQKEELAIVETLESGKPLWQARDEIGGAAELWYYAAGQAQSLHGETLNNLGSQSIGLVLREPIGVVGVITPWNFPFFILSERLPFILASGCTTVLKPSEHTSATTLMMGRILEQAGLPEGVVNIVTGYGDPVGQAIVEHPDVDMVSFTGSTRVGRSTVIASASTLKKVGLELGGKNPVIVTADADLDKAADGIVYGVLHNAGQCCVSGSRLIVADDVREALTEKILALMARVKVGDPFDAYTRVGAIVNEAQMQRILRLISEGGKQGGKLLAGGERTGPSQGFFVAPTVLDGVTQDMSVAREEIFGPVLAITGFSSVEQALTLANDTEYGLSATIWTRDLQSGMDLMRGVRAGRVWVNTTITGGPEMPIGGFKQSGLGRETGRMGVEEYTEVKSVLVDLGERKPWVPAA
jgi:betaine-aldehyde dehydrogenase